MSVRANLSAAAAPQSLDLARYLVDADHAMAAIRKIHAHGLLDIARPITAAFTEAGFSFFQPFDLKIG